MKAGVSIGYVVSVVNLGEVFFFFFLKMVPVVEGPVYCSELGEARL